MSGLRILLIAPQPFYVERGTPIAVRHLAEALCDQGHQVDLLTTHLGEDITYAGLTIHRAKAVGFVKSLPIGFSPAKLVVDAAIGAKMLGLLKANTFDVIHAVEEAVFLALAAKPFSKAKLVYDMDSVLSDQMIEKFPRIGWLGRGFEAFEKRAVRASNLVLPVCEAIADRARQWTDGPVRILPDIAPDRPDTGGHVPSIRQADGGRPLALYVGNLDHYQGIDLLLDAVAKLTPEKRPDLAIIGGSNDAIAHYAEKSAGAGIADTVRFLGPRPLSDLMHYLIQADILCSPRTKGVNTPMKVYAYMASGRPIVATDILSHTQVLDGQCAFLAQPDPESYALALSRAIGNPEESRKIGARAAQIAKHSYGLARFRERLSSAYSTLTSSGVANESKDSGTNN